MADYPVSIELVRRKLLEMRDGMGPYAKYVLNMAITKLEGFPARDVAHGRWEVVQVWKDNPQTTLRCSLCKTWQPIYEHDEWKFCPFCGMPMDAQDMDVPTKDGGAE